LIISRLFFKILARPLQQTVAGDAFFLSELYQELTAKHFARFDFCGRLVEYFNQSVHARLQY